MTNSKLVECSNTPWDPRDSRPMSIVLWIPPDWDRRKMTKEHAELVYHKKSTRIGFADWLLTRGAKQAVTETWKNDS